MGASDPAVVVDARSIGFETVDCDVCSQSRPRILVLNRFIYHQYLAIDTPNYLLDA
jgi:hypothetical protein